jgi:uncharacterized RDD family membrane protein YckC
LTAPAIPAPRARRLAAACYDLLLLLAIWMVTLLASLFLHSLLGAVRNDPVNTLCLYLAGLVFFGWSWTHGGQTLGMRAWRLQLRRAGGAAVRWPVAALRYSLMLLCWLATAAALLLPALPPAVAAEVPHYAPLNQACAALAAAALLWLLLDRRRCALYDRLTSTEVVLLPRDGA